MRSRRLSRLPIVNAAGDDLVGVLTAPRLLSAGSGVPIQRYLQEPVRVQHDVTLAELMTALQQSPSQIAVVRPAGSPVGVVRLDDLLGRLLEQPAVQERP
jgi:CBS domain containing-hemolysin-like protein